MLNRNPEGTEQTEKHNELNSTKANRFGILRFGLSLSFPTFTFGSDSGSAHTNKLDIRVRRIILRILVHKSLVFELALLILNPLLFPPCCGLFKNLAAKIPSDMSNFLVVPDFLSSTTVCGIARLCIL